MQEIRPAGFQVLPAVIKNIIIINVIMVLLSLTLFSTLHIDLADYLGLHYWRSGLFRPWQLVTHMFMHGSADPRALQGTMMHIFFNMFGLWKVGATLENAWGPRRFLIFYFFCGIGAALCQIGVQAIQIEPDLHKLSQVMPWAEIKQQYLSTTPASDTKWALIDSGMVGASGAIFGVLFAFAYMFPNVIFYFGFFLPIKAKYFVAIYAAIELFSGLRPSVGDNVAHFAHLGGMLFGFILLKIWQLQYRRRLY